ncbi:hypothetical protein MAR_019186 [Mya arenaria]|uniref:Uncharacterized protein n=1 Tax=Mya arenaria TaxID=6604 RepID=A0ABY7EGV2_MYAAR|nr:hypothetical protein MAR_019186 [Mya arenaria]
MCSCYNSLDLQKKVANSLTRKKPCKTDTFLKEYCPCKILEGPDIGSITCKCMVEQRYSNDSAKQKKVLRGAIAVTANIRERRFEPGREVQIYEDNPQGVQRFLTPTLLYDLKDTYRGRITDFRTLTGIQYRDPMEAHLLSADARNHTFGNIQGDIEMPTSQNMAEAGFIYIG